MRELDLLQHVYDASTSLPDRVVIGPGDDMALVRLGDRDLLVAVDQVIEDRHFRFPDAPLHLVGRKAVTRSLSDIAAMAGRPVAALATVGLPPDFGAHRATALFDAMRVTAEAYGCPLIGGDVAFLPEPGLPLACTVTVLAEPDASGAVTRGGAKVGDAVYVTGDLGGALTGSGGGGGARHLTFEPRIEEALELRAALGVRLHAMIDISDGLGRDAANVARGSGARIEIDAERIPCAAGVPWRRAASEGEDYELLFTATGPVPDTLGAGVAVTAIGRVREAGAGDDAARVLFRHGADVIEGDDLGWQHESAEEG